LKLAIISHTEHYYQDGQIVGWGPTVREINHLLGIFDEIWHVAVLCPGQAPPSSVAYDSPNIHFVPIQPFGGPGFMDKIKVMWRIPGILSIIRNTLRQVDWFQFRAPTGIGNFVIPYLCLCCKKPGWFKYAGNWVQQHAPIGYRWQRWWLSALQRRKVTMNGHWPGQAAHLLAFENPCLTLHEWETAQVQSAAKQFDKGISLCFAGSLTPNKGAFQLLEAFSTTGPFFFSQIWIAGDGPERARLSAQAEQVPIPVQLTGFLGREQLNALYAKAHFFILPSENEGFPKVVPEAGAYGCIPIVTDVSCIGQYIQDGINGFLLVDNSVETIALKLQKIAGKSQEFIQLSLNARSMSKLFTYEHYLQRIQDEIVAPTLMKKQPPHLG
jgi:glycosyltransferase involved in cell wall biosynthesis